MVQRRWSSISPWCLSWTLGQGQPGEHPRPPARCEYRDALRLRQYCYRLNSAHTICRDALLVGKLGISVSEGGQHGPPAVPYWDKKSLLISLREVTEEG